MIHIEIDEPFENSVDPADIEHVVVTALDDQHAGSDLDVSVVVSGDDELRRLNNDYLGIDAATDVLSFPAEEVDPETGRRYLGDIILSYARAEEQARQGGHSVKDEIRLLVVHGVLHLLGYDHATPEDKAGMWAAQAKILEKIGSPIQYPPD